MKKFKEKLLKIKNDLCKEIKYTKADDIAIALSIYLIIFFQFLTFYGIIKIINLLEH